MTLSSTASDLTTHTPMRTKNLLVRAAAILASLSLLVGLSGCGGVEGKLPGTYSGSAGTTTLVLNKDGSALYSQIRDSGTESGKGNRKVEDDAIHVTVETLDYEIFADLEGFDGSLMFESDDSSWNSEIYTKQE